MSTHAATVDDRDWWMPHAMLAAFVVLVAAILRILFGWSAPLHVWVVVAGFAMGVLAAHAGWHAARRAGARRWREAALAGVFALAFGAMSAAFVRAGQSHLAPGSGLFDDGSAR